MSERRYGLKLDPIVIGQDYILGGYGSLGGTVLQEDGQWVDWLPPNEEQTNKKGFDPLYCASEGTENAKGMLALRKYGQYRNWSARFIAKVSGTTREGNSPHKTAEAVRKYGVPNEVDWPYTDEIATWEEFYCDIPQAIYSLAIAFLNEFDFKHEYVITQPFYLKQALKFSPVGISVCAWFKDGDLYYKPAGMQDNHWCVLVGYKDNEYWLIYDSYEADKLKKVKWDTQFQVAKRYSLERQVVSEKSWLRYLIDLVLAAFDTSPEIVVDHTSPTVPPSPEPKFKWDTPKNARHSIRVICDEEGLTLNEKNELCATVGGESGWDNTAVNHNRNAKGQIVSTDHGIAQINDFYHIGPGKSFPSVAYVLSDPEGVIRWMCKQWKAGNKNWWIAYRSGSWKKFL